MLQAVGTEYITTLTNKKNSMAQQVQTAHKTGVEIKHGFLVVMSCEQGAA